MIDEGDELDLSGLTVDGLYEIAEEAGTNPAWGIHPKDTAEKAGATLLGTSFWEAFKREFHVLLCTKDKSALLLQTW